MLLCFDCHSFNQLLGVLTKCNPILKKVFVFFVELYLFSERDSSIVLCLFGKFYALPHSDSF